MNKMKDETIKAVAAMACISAMVITGLFMGQDGVLLGSGIGLLSGLGGYFAASRKTEQQ